MLSADRQITKERYPASIRDLAPCYRAAAISGSRSGRGGVICAVSVTSDTGTWTSGFLNPWSVVMGEPVGLIHVGIGI